ncbi:probable inactive protein kinase At3g63330 [Solanum dulcamara]|uniref:probable inactive protein kinase At3g63330 n=1 Tax=Solanum dulcamara TaxID=45834 RepID=UPI0024851356|nr:probable inactive protein kinase At3g63330 [Solanum dulcamara]
MNMKGKELRLAFGCLLIFCASYSCAFDQSDYSLVKKLGGGFHGNTWLLKNETYNTTYVLKEIKSEADNLSAQREIYFGEKLSIAESPIGKDNVGRFIEYLDVENRVQLIFIFEGAPLEGLLYQLNVKEQTFEPTDWLTWLRNTTEGRQVMKNIFYQMLLGVKFCHDNGVIHRDINPANIVICFEKTNGSCGVVEPLHTDNMHLRLIDFGSAVDDYARRYLYGPNGPTWAEQNIFSMPPEAIIDHGMILGVLVTLSWRSYLGVQMFSAPQSLRYLSCL